ncbi:hypothetical protein Tco_0819272 [Tanacetum coccineum]|uniref:Uncharacterized protein n=1 Tax=Tanacetum coccineum TaxID=301880 RepID=A0ABQ5A721_9ASTR
MSVSEEDSDPKKLMRVWICKRHVAILNSIKIALQTPTQTSTFKILSNSKKKTDATTQGITTIMLSWLVWESKDNDNGLGLRETVGMDTIGRVDEHDLEAHLTVSWQRFCRTNLDETGRALGEATSCRDSCLIALQNKQNEFEKYKAFNDRITLIFMGHSSNMFNET